MYEGVSSGVSKNQSGFSQGCGITVVRELAQFPIYRLAPLDIECLLAEELLECEIITEFGDDVMLYLLSP